MALKDTLIAHGYVCKTPVLLEGFWTKDPYEHLKSVEVKLDLGSGWSVSIPVATYDEKVAFNIDYLPVNIDGSGAYGALVIVDGKGEVTLNQLLNLIEGGTL